MTLRRTLMPLALRGLAALAAALALSTALAQPAKPVRILVGFPPGGGTDAIARTLSERLKDALGVPVVVENRPGAGGQIAAQVLKASPPDGSTVFLTHDHTISILPLVVKTPGYQPDHDFVPVAGFATFVNAFAVSGGTPAKNFDEYVQWVRTQGGGKGTVGIPAPASTPEFLVKLVGEKFRLDLVSAAYRGAAPMMADMLGNQIGAGVGSVQDFMENHKAGKLRVVAVLGTKRQAAMPQVPTLDELGLKGFADLPYYGFYAPVGTSQKLLNQFAVALAKVVGEPEVRERLTAMGLTVGFMTPQQLAARENAYTDTWRQIIKASGFVPQ
ncbi:MAG: Bug family tripartite tricarboxylate transporter substrate binding protein [Acidovorax soli]|uniref:Bug family tripartite tricarboxylate transporter substrate binding protein n=1 Tax=Acidovorax soli TaxID=592050 RepID=UPI0026F2ACF2|nr:Bug family tripartite tricarboxylate transporter substrate binding protein [Acidovorax soli]MCM2347057.1 Bug family tripartite tricarboxylate transporter substrate binding protein [Acidovorax soli]